MATLPDPPAYEDDRARGRRTRLILAQLYNLSGALSATNEQLQTLIKLLRKELGFTDDDVTDPSGTGA